jgi:hypothetical protein
LKVENDEEESNDEDEQQDPEKVSLALTKEKKEKK